MSGGVQIPLTNSNILHYILNALVQTKAVMARFSGGSTYMIGTLIITELEFTKLSKISVNR